MPRFLRLSCMAKKMLGRITLLRLIFSFVILNAYENVIVKFLFSIKRQALEGF